MYDWNKNGKYDSFDSYVDYNLANTSSNSGSGSSSDGWLVFLLAVIGMACPLLGFFIFIIILLFGK